MVIQDISFSSQSSVSLRFHKHTTCIIFKHGRKGGRGANLAMPLRQQLNPEKLLQGGTASKGKRVQQCPYRIQRSIYRIPNTLLCHYRVYQPSLYSDSSICKEIRFQVRNLKKQLRRIYKSHQDNFMERFIVLSKNGYNNGPG